MLTAALTAPAAHAKVYNYACKVEGEQGIPQVYSAKIDTVKRTITWRGSVFKNLKEFADDGTGEDCAKYCFRATSRNGDVAFVETATQGGASLTITSGGPGTDGIDGFDCDIIR
jgi:hypothetical protein